VLVPQVVASAEEKEPAGHTICIVLLQKKPGKHEKHADSPVALLNLPVGQGLTELAPAMQYPPAVQLSHVDRPVWFANLPTAHGLQAVAIIWPLLLPLGHNVHALAILWPVKLLKVPVTGFHKNIFQITIKVMIIKIILKNKQPYRQGRICTWGRLS
jgi:hypothetical protein